MKTHQTILIGLLLTILAAGTATADATDTISTNLGLQASDIILLITILGCIICTAFDARVALMFATLLFASEFIVFYQATDMGYTGFQPYHAGLCLITCIILLALSLLITYKKESSGVT